MRSKYISWIHSNAGANTVRHKAGFAGEEKAECGQSSRQVISRPFFQRLFLVWTELKIGDFIFLHPISIGKWYNRAQDRWFHLSRPFFPKLCFKFKFSGFHPFFIQWFNHKKLKEKKEKHIEKNCHWHCLYRVFFPGPSPQFFFVLRMAKFD